MTTNPKWKFCNVPFNRGSEDDMNLLGKLEELAERLGVSRSATVRLVLEMVIYDGPMDDLAASLSNFVSVEKKE